MYNVIIRVGLWISSMFIWIQFFFYELIFEIELNSNIIFSDDIKIRFIPV